MYFSIKIDYFNINYKKNKMNDADVCSICLEPLGTVNIIKTR